MSNYERIINKEKREATIRMYGVIGREVDGNQMAHDIAELDEAADTIHILINSDGGSVSQGLSVVSAILSAKAYICARINGIAASMAAVIAISADKVEMQDFAKLMIHDPFFVGVGKEKLSAKDKKALDSITDTLRTILSRRGIGKEKIAKLMRDETWFSADEAKTAGLADEVVTTPRKEEWGNLSVSELLNRVMNEYKPNTKKDMKEIAKALGLSENATEQQILDAIKSKEKTWKEREQSIINHLMALGEKNGAITEKNKDRMARLASVDFELFAEMISDAQETASEGPDKNDDTLTKKTVVENRRLSNLLNKTLPGKKKEGAGKDNRTWDWYQKNDPEALLRMERDEPERFQTLLNEYEQSI